MRFSDLLGVLLPTVEKGDLIEDIRCTVAELEETTIPSYENCIDFLKKNKLRNKKFLEQEKIFKRHRRDGDSNFFVDVLETCKRLVENLEVVEDLTRKSGTDYFVKEGMTYYKANILQYVEYAGFVSKYARKYILYAFMLEASEYDAATITIKDSLSPAEIQWLDINMLNFALAMNSVGGEKRHVEKVLKDIPEVVITSDNEDTLKASGVVVDPMHMGFIASWLNPIYHVRIAIVEWQHARYKAAVEERQAIQLRKLYLERLAEGKNDPALEKQISYMDTQLQDLNYKINQIEKDVK